MKYISTRGGMSGISSAEAIKTGLAPDGGLFVPESAVRLTSDEINQLAAMDYNQRAVFILERFLTDYSHDEIVQCVEGAYGNGKFEGDTVSPMHKLNDTMSILELWHGPTCAFKDVALQILPYLLVKAVQKADDTSETVILVATSGDTGKAALEGFKDVKGTRVIVFYPEEGVSEVQRMQMVTQEGGNVCSVAVKGNFDDAQNGVKAIFADSDLKEEMLAKGFKFSSANSINWGRLVPQIVYYFSAYADLLASGEVSKGEQVNYTVPTGNFGNILAAWYAREMGLPIKKLICASNDNNVLTDFIRTGVYDKNREFKKTISPSMDILISSNLERLLFELNGHDGAKVKEWMDALNKDGKYSVDDEVRHKISDLYWSECTTEKETMKTIAAVYEEYGYVVDTHTAVGIDVYDKYLIATHDMTKAVIASTASPFKFNDSVASAILGKEAVEGKSEFDLLRVLSTTCGLAIPSGLAGLEHKEILHRRTCSREGMKEEVKDILGLA